MIRVLMTGASGLIGSALASSFLGRGYALEYLVRRPSRNAQELEYRPQLPIAPTLLSHRDIIIHLAGESVVGRWTEEKKAQIRVSRVLSTRNLSEALVAAKPRPRLFLCASAIGYYGDRGEEILTERSSSQGGFLAELCREWEEATYPARDAGMRTVNLRIGVVLSRQGGALKAMLPAFRRGLGGTIGGGRQWWSWIDLSDLVAAVEHVVESKELSGPINITAPEPVRNSEFTRALAQALKRPALLPIPAWLAQIALGQFAQEGLLASARVLPEKLIESGFRFKYPELTLALNDLLA